MTNIKGTIDGNPGTSSKVEDDIVKFAEHFKDTCVVGRMLKNWTPGRCLPVDKYGRIWREIHEIAISLDDLLVFFKDGHNAVFERSFGRLETRRLKKNRESLAPSDDVLASLFKAYEDSVKNRCGYLSQSPFLQKRLLDSFCKSVYNTAGVFPCSQYPWIMATTDVVPFMMDGKSIILQCEILQDSEWIVPPGDVAPGQPLKTPKSRPLAASKRKVCRFHNETRSMLDACGTIHHQEEFAYNPDIRELFDVACSEYTKMVYNHVHQPIEIRGFAELKTWQQPRKKFKQGSVVFQVKSKRRFPGCFGKVHCINGDKIYVNWHGDKNSKNRPCSKESLRLVPILKIKPPTRDGDMVAITGGDHSDRYGKIVKVVDCRRGKDNKIRVQDAVGHEFKIHQQFLHVVQPARQHVLTPKETTTNCTPLVPDVRDTEQQQQEEEEFAEFTVQ